MSNYTGFYRYDIGDIVEVLGFYEQAPLIIQCQLQRGIPDSQLKFPHISEDRSFLAGLPVEQEIHLPEDRGSESSV